MSDGGYHWRGRPQRYQAYSETESDAVGEQGYDRTRFYQPYTQRGHDTGTPQNWGYDEYSRHSTYENESFGDSSRRSGYSGYESYATYGSGNVDPYSPYQLYHEQDQRYLASGYSSYGRHSDDRTRSYSDGNSHLSYSSYSSHQPQTLGQESQRRRRASPVYDDYTPGSSSTSHSIPSSSPSRQYHTTASSSSEPYLHTSSFSLRTRPRPPIKEKRTKPTDEYLSISSEPSETVAEESERTRKLIVLDLNGTLLLRSQHRKAGYVPPTGGGASAGLPFQVRTVYPRPYLSTFVEYILHGETKKWLDAMVWSSAQPRSVDDMVGRSFAERKGELRAIWARDTLGLSNEDYNKKSITLKDLEKPWAELPFKISIASRAPSNPSPPTSPSQEPPPPGTPSISRASSPAPPPPSSQITSVPSSPPRYLDENQRPNTQLKQYHHSALTTLLIDDSPVKASLQPWNHLCIREYVAEMRKADLEILMQEGGEEGGITGAGSKKKTREGKKERHRVRDARLRREEKEKESEKTDIVSENGVPVSGDLDAESGMAATSTAGGEDEPTRAPVTDVVHDSSIHGATTTTTTSSTIHEDDVEPAVGPSTKDNRDKEYDQTLLAVIGVLDRIRYESNVAGWMRAGGLMHVGRHGVEINVEVEDSGKGSAPKDIEAEVTGEERHFAFAKAEEDLVNNEPVTEKGKGKGKTKLIHTPPTRSRDASPLLVSFDSKKRRRVGDIETEAEAEDGGLRVGMGIDARADDGQDQQKLKAEEAEREAQAMTGIPLESSPSTTDTIIKTSTSAIRVDDVDLAQQPPRPSAVDASTKEDLTQQETEPDKPKLWFEHPDILAHWAARGKKALGDLGIAIVVGVRQ